MFFTHTKPPGVRSSTAEAYLLSARNRKNLQIIKNGVVTKVLIDDHNQAYGVEAITKRGVQRFYANKEVIVSAGPINSPKVLIASGIGPKADVLRLGIKPVADLPVGYNLQNHFYVPLVFTGGRTPDDVSPHQSEQKITLDTWPFPVMYGFFSLHGTREPDLQILCGYMNQSSPLALLYFNSLNYNDQVVSSFVQANHKHEFFIINFILLREKSRGKVTVKSVEPSADPEIYEGFLNDLDDLRRLVKGMKKVYDLAHTSYLSKTGSQIVRPYLPKCDHFEFLTDEYLVCYIRHLITNQHHEVGTCPMSRVVDTNLKVYGVENLRVVDSSVMPFLTSGNTYTPTVMIAEKISDVIKNYYRH